MLKRERMSGAEDLAGLLVDDFYKAVGRMPEEGQEFALALFSLATEPPEDLPETVISRACREASLNAARQNFEEAARVTAFAAMFAKEPKIRQALLEIWGGMLNAQFAGEPFEAYSEINKLLSWDSARAVAEHDVSHADGVRAFACAKGLELAQRVIDERKKSEYEDTRLFLDGLSLICKFDKGSGVTGQARSMRRAIDDLQDPCFGSENEWPGTHPGTPVLQ